MRLKGHVASDYPSAMTKQQLATEIKAQEAQISSGTTSFSVLSIPDDIIGLYLTLRGKDHLLEKAMALIPESTSLPDWWQRVRQL
jgi:hypothetical protein